ncbi:uncharacterized protein LOC133307809 [Gastrolobium bilobum]|uniref:uncharacterized protein LOC133307809 n=1 Tax=Gastrolobium bilobum TaxID=150636 RepID=UPI002AB276C1|nr:uncharacterized protein LOC133307809 [Gastrolobium bilobum]
MVLVQASKVTLPNPCSLSSPPSNTCSILFEPNSLSLALTHSDSSLSLYPSFSPLSPSSSSSSSLSLHTPQTLIPSPSSSSTFLLLQQSHTNPNSTPSVLFIVSAPHRSGSQILLRFYILHKKNNAFARVQNVLCSNNKGFRFEPKLGVLIDSKHGVSIKLAGSVNYFAMYSVSSSKVWVFAVKMCDDDDNGDDGGGLRVKLIRCAVIECSRPVWSVSISFGFLLLGEENGVRVFGLRRLVKGRVVKRVRNSNSNLKQLPNGVVVGRDNHGRHGGRDRGGKRYGGEGVVEVTCNGDLEGKIERHGVVVKQTNVKFKQDDSNACACFVALKENEVETKSMAKVSMSVKAISIQALSRRMFVILDSHGDLYLLCLSNSGIGVDITGHVRQLPHIMKVKSLAVLPDVSTLSQTVWISDGCHSVHMFTIMDEVNAINEADGNDGGEKLLHLPVIRVLFSSEKIQDVISLTSNSILILGQGSLYAYAIS